MSIDKESLQREQVAGRSWARQAARASMVAPFAALLVQVLGFQLAAKRDEATADMLYFLCSSLAMLFIVAGFASGLAGYLGGRRQRSLDTQIIAGLGMLASGGLLALVCRAMLLVWWK